MMAAYKNMLQYNNRIFGHHLKNFHEMFAVYSSSELEAYVLAIMIKNLIQYYYDHHNFLQEPDKNERKFLRKF